MWLYVVLRLGLLASTASFFTFFILSTMPPSFSGSAWYFSGLLPPVLAVFALAAYGLRYAIGGRERA